MLINYFVILITLLLVSGLAIDAGMLEWRQLHLQNAADAAALEGMLQHARGDTSWMSQAQAQAANNGQANGVSNVTVTLSNPPVSGNYVGDSYAVQATVTQTVGNLFMGLVNEGKSTIAATATAREIPTCIWVMQPTNSVSNSGSFQIASGGVNANCGVYINTTTGGSLLADGFSSLRSLRTRIVGPASSNLSTGTVIPRPRYGSTAKTDPLAYVSAPVWSTCDYTSNVTVSGYTGTVSPGAYCGSLSISNSTLTLNPGLYIIAGGMTVNNSTLSGTGVTLYFTKTSGASSYSTINFNQSYLYLTAPTNTQSGGITGILMFADRNWPNSGSAGVNIQTSTVTCDGIWYLPSIGLYFWNNSGVNCYNYMAWVVDWVYEFGTSIRFNTNYASLGGTSPFHFEDGVLVQ